MEKYTVWTWPYATRYYITHPWKWFKHLFRNIRDAQHRSRYGWCYGDVWDWDTWFLKVAPPMLRYMADFGSAYPGREPFEDAEKWHKWLYHIADLLETGLQDWQDDHNEYYTEYMDHILEHRGKDELSKKYWDRANELAEQGEANVKEALNEIGSNFHSIWD